MRLFYVISDIVKGSDVEKTKKSGAQLRIIFKIIQSHEFAEAQKAIFDMIWNSVAI